MLKKILIVGAGSAGGRHGRNIAALGSQVSFVDPAQERLFQLGDELEALGTFSTIEQALSADAYDGAVIASPPAFHVDQSLALLAANIPVLLEKPVAPTLSDALRLRAKLGDGRPPLLLGYTWRWWPPLIALRERIENKALGRLRHVRFVMSAHLADWHPWERYQDFFMSSNALGGGALLDESHWIDLMIWLFGMPEWISADVSKISDLQLDVDDNVDLICGYGEDLRVTLHLDLFGRPHEKSITFVGDLGSVVWRDTPNGFSIGKEAESTWDFHAFSCTRNDMFVDVAREFVAVIDGDLNPSCTIDDGCEVLRVVVAARTSSAEQRRILLRELEL